MDPARFARVKELLLEARELPVAEREAHLRRAAGDDPQLADEVLSLLEQEASPARIVEEGALPAPAPPRHPEQVGPYRITGVLGEGGMGIVYRAAQGEPLPREVALKLVRSGMASDRVLRRFHYERQSLARMDHPHIASVLDAGSDEHGRPWFVMPLVEGRPLTTYCDEEQLGVEARLGLFTEICRAVQHAHQRGVLHRDLKPGNILVREVQGRPVPTVIDFGIARALQPGEDDAALTQDGQRIGTPAYMSPEQLRGEESAIDTRSDVYALGVILYELLAGRHPWADSRETAPTVDEAVELLPPSRAVRLGDTTARALERGTTIRELSRRLRGDLDTICLMAVRAEPARRYASAAHLADDIVRYRRGEPVSARPDSWRYRAGKFVRRHPAGSVAAVLGLLLVAVAAGMSALHAQNMQEERDRALAAERRAQDEADAAQSMAGFLEGLFVLAEPGGARDRGELSARELLQQGVDRIPEELAGQPWLQSRMLLALGRAEHALGEYAMAESLCTAALEQLRRAGDVEATARDLHAADIHSQLASTLHDRTRYAEAARQDSMALELLRAHHPGDHPSVAYALNSLAIDLQAQGDVATGVELVRESLEMTRRLADGPDADQAWGWGTLGYLNFKLGRYDESLEQLEHALAMAREVFAGEDHFEMLYALNNYGGLCEFLDELDRAEPVLREALEMSGRMYPAADHPALSRAWTNLGRVRLKRGDLEGAGAMFQEAMDCILRGPGPDHAHASVPRSWLAELAIRRGEFARAAGHAREARRVRELNYEAGNPRREQQAMLEARLHTEAGRPAEALPLLHDYLAWAGEEFGEQHYQTMWARAWLGRCRARVGDGGGLAELARAHAWLRERMGPGHHSARRSGQWLERLSARDDGR